MPQELGRIEAIFRYPVKSMRGESLEAIRSYIDGQGVVTNFDVSAGSTKRQSAWDFPRILALGQTAVLRIL
jgi:uncharacterized protein YcbX